LSWFLLAAAPFAPVDQEYLFEARQMQALSFAVHIPIVCFSIAFRAFVLLLEGLWLRTGDRVYPDNREALVEGDAGPFCRRRRHRHDPQLRARTPVAELHGHFDEVFGLGFTLEAFSFFVEAIFIAIYVYGWDRLSPRAHFLSGIPVVAAGFTGSLMVLTVNAWMNSPGGFTLVGGRVSDVRPLEALFGNDFLWHELIHMYLAGYIVAGFLTASVYAWGWLRGRRGRYERVAFVVPLTVARWPRRCRSSSVTGRRARLPASSRQSSLPSRTCMRRRRARPSTSGAGTTGTRFATASPSRGSCPARLPRPRCPRRGVRGDAAPGASALNVVRVAFQTMVGIGFLLAGIAAVYLLVWLRRRRLPQSAWFYRAVVAAGPLSVVALIAGWVTTEVGRQPWVVYGHMRTEEAVTGASGIPVGYASLVLVYAGLLAAVVWILRRLARAPEVQPGPSGVAPLLAGASRAEAEGER
jgi:cytochrome d ubiquinol oxidase subunit I